MTDGGSSLSQGDPTERKPAIKALAESTHSAALEELARLAQRHHARDTRIEAAFALAEKTLYQDNRALRGLVEALGESTLAERAADALTRIGSPEALAAVAAWQDGQS